MTSGMVWSRPKLINQDFMAFCPSLCSLWVKAGSSVSYKMMSNTSLSPCAWSPNSSRKDHDFSQSKVFFGQAQVLGSPLHHDHSQGNGVYWLISFFPFFFFFWLHCAGFRILVPKQGIEPTPPATLHWELRVLTTGPPENFLIGFLSPFRPLSKNTTR